MFSYSSIKLELIVTSELTSIKAVKLMDAVRYVSLQ